MALTAMIGLDGLAMGIAAIACVGGSFTNGIVFHRLRLGDKSNVIAVMMEPLTQAPIITANPIPIYGSNFFGGGLAGVSAAVFHIINNAPGTASPIPGLLAPFAFNNPMNVVLAVVFAAIGGTLAGFVGSQIFKKQLRKESSRKRKTARWQKLRWLIHRIEESLWTGYRSRVRGFFGSTVIHFHSSSKER